MQINLAFKRLDEESPIMMIINPGFFSIFPEDSLTELRSLYSYINSSQCDAFNNRNNLGRHIRGGRCLCRFTYIYIVYSTCIYTNTHVMDTQAGKIQNVLHTNIK